MAQLQKTLYSLRDDRLIHSWKQHSENCATMNVKYDLRIDVFISDETYIISLKEVVGAHEVKPTLQYVVINYFQYITAEVEKFCKDNNIEVISYKELRHKLHQIHGR